MGKRKEGGSYLNNMIDRIFGNNESQTAQSAQSAQSTVTGGKAKRKTKAKGGGESSPLNTFVDSAMNMLSGSTPKGPKESVPLVGGKRRGGKRQGGSGDMNKHESFDDMNMNLLQGGKRRGGKRRGGDGEMNKHESFADMNKHESFADMNINSIAPLEGGGGKNTKKRRGGNVDMNKQESFADMNEMTILPFKGGKGRKTKKRGGSGEYQNIDSNANIVEGREAELGDVPINMETTSLNYFNVGNSMQGGGKYKQNKKKGGVVLELSPFLVSLITLGARVAADPKLKSSDDKGSKASKASKGSKGSKKSLGGDGELFDCPVTKEYSNYPFGGDSASEPAPESVSGGGKRRNRKARGGSMQEVKDLLPMGMH